jgi:hypothetical protein
MWAGVAIVSIWRAVLLVAVALFALIATVFLACWGFRSRRAERKEDGAS